MDESGCVDYPEIRPGGFSEFGHPNEHRKKVPDRGHVTDKREARDAGTFAGSARKT